MRVKICGITNLEDALAAVRLGADALGFVMAPSPRRVEPDQVRGIIAALPPMVAMVGVFVDAALEDLLRIRSYCGLDAVQLHGAMDDATLEALGGPRRVLAVQSVGRGRLPEPGAMAGATLLLDAYSPDAHGGTGKTFDWNIASQVARQRPVVLAGGLGPDNIQQAIRTVRPFAVDVSSGVEARPGRKDHEKLAKFIANAKSAD